MTDLDILDQDIKKIAVVRCLIQIISNDNTLSMYFERDLYNIINRYSAYIDRTFYDIKNKLHPAAMNTGGRVFGSTGSGGGGSSDEPSDSGPFQYHSMNIPQVPIDNNNNNNDLNLDPLNLAGNNNNQPSGTNEQADADKENPAVNQVLNVNTATEDQQKPAPQVISTDFLVEIARRTQAKNGQNPEAIRVYVGTAPADDPVISRDRILAAARIALRDLTWRCSHAYRAKFTDYMKIKASKDRHLIDRQIRKLKNFIDWLEGTKFSRGHGKHRKAGNQYDQTKLEREANDAGVVIIQQNSPGREFNSASTTDMLRLKKHLLEKLKGKKYKNFDHIFEREFKRKFPNGTFTQKQGDEFVNELFRLFMNCIFYKRFDLGTLVSVIFGSGENRIMLGKEAVNVLALVDLARDGYLNNVIASENRDLLKKRFDKFKKNVNKKQNERLTPADISGLATSENIPIKFSVQGNSEIYHNNVEVYEEINNSPAGSPAPVLEAQDLSSTSYNLDDSSDLSGNNPFSKPGSSQVPPPDNSSILSSSADMPSDREQFTDMINQGIQQLTDFLNNT